MPNQTKVTFKVDSFNISGTNKTRASLSLTTDDINELKKLYDVLEKANSVGQEVEVSFDKQTPNQ